MGNAPILPDCKSRVQPIWIPRIVLVLKFRHRTNYTLVLPKPRIFLVIMENPMRCWD